MEATETEGRTDGESPPDDAPATTAPEATPEEDVERSIPDESPDIPEGEDAPEVEKAPTDLGVPMLEGDASEPSGPEDAGGVGPKRGEYDERIAGSERSHEMVRTDGVGATGAAGELVENDDGGLDRAPHTTAVPQAPRFEDRGEVPGQKGGVDTDPRS